MRINFFRWLHLKWQNYRNKKKYVDEDEEGYVVVIHIHVLKDGDARITYNGDLMVASRVLDETKKLLKQELENKKGIVIKDRGKFTVIGDKKDGVLSSITVKEG